MMTNEEDFTKTKRSTVKRGREYSDYSKEKIYKILDSGYMCCIAYVSDGKPCMNPTLYWREGDYVYWHGSAASRMLREQAKGAEVCFNVCHLDGLLLGRSAFHHSANYRSVTIFGKAELVEDEKDKLGAIQHLIESFYPGRMNELRGHKEHEVRMVKVLRLPIEEVSSKHRYDASIMDILRRQESDAIEEYGSEGENPHCWTGLIPIRTITETPIADSATDPKLVWPRYLSSFRFEREF